MWTSAKFRIRFEDGRPRSVAQKSFVTVCGREQAAAISSASDLRIHVIDRAKAAFALGCAQWPTIRGLTFEAFHSFAVDGAIEPEVLEERAGDIFLAAAAAGGDDDAVKLFDSQVLAQLPRWFARLRLPADRFDEIGQMLRAKLLVGPDPKLAQYRASGPLAGWVRMVAVRTALDSFRDHPNVVDADPADAIVKAFDPEQQLIRQKYGTLFEAALRDAMSVLTMRDRNLLRLHYISRMSLDAIARMYHVHRATVVRWLASIRDEVETAVRLRLWEEVGVSPAEFRSLWNAVRSEVDVSLSRLLTAG
jgi:RNA polymerase sigma-70 factor (ECF subfamily)